MSERTFFLHIDGESQGPYAASDIRAWIESGRLDPSVWAWNGAGWKPAFELVADPAADEPVATSVGEAHDDRGTRLGAFVVMKPNWFKIDVTYLLVVTKSALCFGKVGGQYLDETSAMMVRPGGGLVGALAAAGIGHMAGRIARSSEGKKSAIENVDPMGSAFLALDAANFRLSIDRIAEERLKIRPGVSLWTTAWNTGKLFITEVGGTKHQYLIPGKQDGDEIRSVMSKAVPCL